MADRTPYQEPLIPDWAAPAYLVVSAVTALVYLMLEQAAPGLGTLAIVKTSAIGLLAFYALFNRAPVLALALAFSAAGDFALAISPPLLDWAIILFGLAHLIYIGLFVRFILRDGLRKEGLVLVAALIAFGLAMGWWLSPATGALTTPVLAYLALIIIMASAAALVRGPRLILAGALLFVVSDSLLAADLFREIRPVAGLNWMNFGVWLSYYLAQAALVVGIVRHARTVSDAKTAHQPPPVA